jgi:hypothetical protein
LRTRIIISILVSLLSFLATSCGTLQSSSWVSFTDSLGKGSKVEPSKVLVNIQGRVDVSMTKPADPEWVPNTTLNYPYAGIMMMFRESGRPIDISDATGLILEYRSEGTISLILAQKDVPTGSEYRLILPAQMDFTVSKFSWQDFKQPSWVDTSAPLNLMSIAGIMFTNSSQKQSTARLTIRHVSFPGWSDPDSLLSKINWKK